MSENEIPENLVPFDPSKHKPQDLGLGEDGELSTEHVITTDSPTGDVWNIPTVWFGPDGRGYKLPDDISQRLAYSYEKGNKGQWPRFPKGEYDVAGQDASARSKEGGATKRPLFQLFDEVE
jgi:hypothetical protein